MDKPFITSYVFVGNRSEIRLLYGKLRYLSKLKTRLIPGEKCNTSLRCVAKLFCPEWEHFNESGYYFDLRLTNDRQINLTVNSEQLPPFNLWYKLCRKYLSVKVYYFGGQKHSGHYTTNDMVGRFFPHRYMLVDTYDNYYPLSSPWALSVAVKQFVPVTEPFTTIESYAKELKDKLNGLRIFDILVVDPRGKCITPNQNLISQWL